VATTDTYCGHCGELGHFTINCPQTLKLPMVKPTKPPVEPFVPDNCPACGTNLRSKTKRAEYMRRYMKRWRAKLTSH